MSQTDDWVFELLDESDLVLSPAVTAVNLDYSRNWFFLRMSKLEDADLIEKVNGSYYQITKQDRAYLEGELEATELRK